MRFLFFFAPAYLAACAAALPSSFPDGGADSTADAPSETDAGRTLTGTFGAPITFATHAELVSYGFAWGPSDGQFGAIHTGGSDYVFYGTAGSTASCAGTPNVEGSTFSFTGTLDH